MDTRTLLLAAVISASLATIANANPTVVFNSQEGPSAIGELDCVDRLGETLNISATYDTMGGLDTFEMSLVMFSGDETSCLSDGSVNCPGLTVSEDSVCACIEKTTTDSIVWSGTLSSLGDVASVLCSRSTTVHFRADIAFDLDDREDEVSQTIELVTDMEAPTTPESKPVVRAAEGALVISLAEADRSNTDVANHEVCVRTASASGSVSDAGVGSADSATLEDLRDGFSLCRTTESLKSDDYRFESLTNDTVYEVVVAAYDEAGNRSGNSPIATAQPASLLDFAELYDSRLAGADGETGGCTTSPTKPSIGLLGLLLLFGMIRRVRSC